MTPNKCVSGYNSVVTHRRCSTVVVEHMRAAQKHTPAVQRRLSTSGNAVCGALGIKEGSQTRLRGPQDGCSLGGSTQALCVLRSHSPILPQVGYLIMRDVGGRLCIPHFPGITRQHFVVLSSLCDYTIGKAY